MIQRTLLALAALSLLLASCTSTSTQFMAMPDQTVDIEDANMSRVYIIRGAKTPGQLRDIHIIGGATKLGVLRHGNYLCMELEPGRWIFETIFDEIALEGEDIESYFDVTLEAGTTRYFVVNIEHAGRKPVGEEVTPAKGRELIADLEPATVTSEK